MLYSPILSFLRIFPFFLWIFLCGLSQFINHFLLRNSFFFFFKIFFKGIVKIFGIKINLEGLPQIKNTLFVSNHISYLDIIILGSIVEGRFVAKSEIQSKYRKQNSHAKCTDSFLNVLDTFSFRMSFLNIAKMFFH